MAMPNPKHRRRLGSASADAVATREALVRDDEQPMLVRQSLHDEVVPLLRDMIINGTLKPGEKIAERELCERIGVSRTPLREALKVLASEGLVQLMPRRGAVVAVLTDDEVVKLFPIVGVIEALAAETACRTISDAGIAAIRSTHDKMIEAYRRRDWLRYAHLNRSIHDSVFAATGNDELVSFYRQLTIRIRARRYQQQDDQQVWAESVDDHEKIMTALERRDGSEIGRLMRLHLEHKEASIRRAIANEE